MYVSYIRTQKQVTCKSTAILHKGLEPPGVCYPWLEWGGESIFCAPLSHHSLLHFLYLNCVSILKPETLVHYLLYVGKNQRTRETGGCREHRSPLSPGSMLGYKRQKEMLTPCSSLFGPVVREISQDLECPTWAGRATVKTSVSLTQRCHGLRCLSLAFPSPLTSAGSPG